MQRLSGGKAMTETAATGEPSTVLSNSDVRGDETTAMTLETAFTSDDG